jgi:NAD(P)-dependent dehydrogenase (short-subunit alcohol dehydrogenase family)
MGEGRGDRRHQGELSMGERLKGKVALVAGAGCVGPGWGNGRATSVIFAQEGARVFAVDRDSESMKEPSPASARLAAKSPPCLRRDRR